MSTPVCVVDAARTYGVDLRTLRRKVTAKRIEPVDRLDLGDGTRLARYRVADIARLIDESKISAGEYSLPGAPSY